LLETERLLLRLPRPEDAEPMSTFLADREVMRFLGGETVPHSAAPVVLQRWIDDWATYPAGKFIVQLRDTGAVIGRVGLNFFDPQTWHKSQAADAQPELGWAIGREHWGNGYATEAARAVRRWAGRRHLISLIAPENTRSARVAERLGARPTHTVCLPDGGDHVVWEHPA
jgi:RimJ/RimL family protein N-acetyltransferase